MATIGNTALTFTDWAKRYQDKKVAIIVEMLAQTNAILDDMRWIEGNLPTGHMHTVRTGLPSGTWRMLNYGIQPSKSTTAQVQDQCGMLEALAEVDAKLADLGGNTASFRLSEDKGFIEGLSQQMAQALIYGNQSVNPERITGLAARYSTIVAATSQSAKNVIDAGGTGTDNTSIWLVVWGNDQAFGIFPKGTQAGLKMEDMGRQILYDNQVPPGKYVGYRTHYVWDAGFTVRDWRYVVRIANIDVTDLALMTSTALNGAPDLLMAMGKAIHLPPSLSNGTPVWYANRYVRQYIDMQKARQSGLNITLTDVKEGQYNVMNSVAGIPIKTVDQISNAEARVI